MDYPVHDERRLRFHSSEGLKESLKRRPLTREFIDWVVRNGYKIKYLPDLPKGEGFAFFEPRLIVVSSQGEPRVINAVIVHELIHISVPGMTPNYIFPRSENSYEMVIDEIAEGYLGDSEFLEYLNKKIPVLR